MTEIAAVKIEMKLGGSWVDVTSDVLSVSPINCSQGIMGAGPLDRVAGTGRCTFELRNDKGCTGGVMGYYTPGHTNCRAGFEAGIECRVSFTYDGVSYPTFYGRIPYGGINPTSGQYTLQRTGVEVRDWFDQAGMHDLMTPQFAQNKRSDMVAALIVEDMPIAPLDTDYRTGLYIYGSVFDTVRAKTRAITEFNKLVMSESGYLYLVHDTAGYERLTLESKRNREENEDLSEYYKLKAEGSKLKAEDGTFILLEEGGNLLLDERYEYPASFDNSFIGVTAGVSPYYYNSVTVKTFPRKVDTEPVILWELQTATKIEPGQTITLSGRYKDPVGGSKSVSGIDMIAPVDGLDYLFNETAEGDGHNWNWALEITATYSTSGVEYTLKNNHTELGYVTRLRARGTGVYVYDTVEQVAEDESAFATLGRRPLVVEMRYQDDPADVDDIAEEYLEIYNSRRMVIHSVRFMANVSEFAMRSFLNFRIGHRIRLKEAVTVPVAEDYFINGIEWTMIGNVIYYTWYVKSAATELSEDWSL